MRETQFQDQIEKRRRADQERLEDSCRQVADVVLGQHAAEATRDGRGVTERAIDEVLAHYHYKPVQMPEGLQTAEEQLDYCLRHYGLMQRPVSLEEGWQNDAFGPMLGRLKDSKDLVALLPAAIRGYYYTDPETGRRVRITKRTAARIEADAICLYRPLPLRELGVPDLLRYMRRCVSVQDILLVVMASLAVSAVGLLIPRITAVLTGPVADTGRVDVLVGAAVCLFCVALSSQLLSSVSSLLSKRIGAKTSLGVDSSMMMRLISLPANFFRQYSPGELSARAGSVNELCTMMEDVIINTGLTSLCSLLYITQIVSFAPALAIPSIVIILATVTISVVTTLVQVKISRRQLDLNARESGMSYAMITGIQKIKLAGAEKRVFARWLDLYARSRALTYNPPLIIKVSGVITTGITLLSTIVLYYLAATSGITPSSYIAFNVAYGSVMGAFSALSGIVLTVARIRPVLEMAEPFLKEVPEASGDREIVTDITGGVELSHVSFRYDEDGPLVLRDLSLSVEPGEYVAIVGKTGCGKSTLVRLLLGFETPEKGAVYYDGKNVSSLDLPSLRRHIGTVTQDGGLFQGSVYSNIVITAPQLTLADAWEAAEVAGIADDIREMPMQMHTLISEGQGEISGGQRQRLMIARAIAPKPKLLILDEATSALDNVTQRQVSEALDNMGCTRIVVAHRLSTIRHCNRILVLDGGRIIEDGTYDELIERDGYFAELVKRQRLDTAKCTEAGTCEAPSRSKR